MTSLKDITIPIGHGSFQTSIVSSMKTVIGYKLPLTVISVLIVLIVWVSPPPSFLSYSQLSTSQIQTFLSSPVTSTVNHPYHPSRPYSENSSASDLTSDVWIYHESQQRSPPRPDVPIVKDESEKAAQQRQEDSKNPSAPQSNSSSVDKGSEPGRQKQQPEETGHVPQQHENVTGSQVINNHTTLDSGSNVTTETVLPRVSEDTQLVDLTVSEPAIQDDPQLQPETKYIMPLLSFQVGTGNQLIEYKSAIVVARTLNRTLCLSPFFIGPGRHFGYLGDRHSGLYMEQRYDIDVLSKMVKVASMEECMQKCEKKLDAHWRFRRVSKAPQWESWFNDTPRGSVDFDRNAAKWSSTADVAAGLGPRNEPRCVGLGGLFPGLRWRGVLFASSVYLQHSKAIMKSVDFFQVQALGSHNPNYIAVHWRFEESNCRGHPLGLCFSRCTDGAVIANGRRSETWENMTREGKKGNTKDGFNGVFVTQEDVSGAIYDRAIKHGVRNVYLSTDGWLRGPESTAILKWVVEDLRNKSMNVAGLWQIYGLPNFADGSYVVSGNIGQVLGLPKTEKVSNHMIALVEQEICVRSAVFIGSGQSSWSLAVSDTRLGRQCKDNISKEMKELNPELPDATIEERAIDKILTIQYTPGPTCRDKSYRPAQPIGEEEPDGWLDYDSCEQRLLDGIGKCTRITT